MRRYFILALAFLGIILISAFIVFQFRCMNMSCITTKHLLIGNVIEIYEQTPKTYRALFSTTFGLFRVEKQSGLSAADAKNLTDITLMKMQGLFDNARSPYPGPLSDEIACSNKYKPTPITYNTPSTDMILYTGYANNRLQYGTCIDDQITHKGYIALLYCKNYASWYKAELLIPIHEVQNDVVYIQLLQGVQCRPSFVNTGVIFP